MEIVIENSGGASANPVTSDNSTTAAPSFATQPSISNPRPYRTAYVTNDVKLLQNSAYYHTLQAIAVTQQSRPGEPGDEPTMYEANMPIQTSLKRVDRSGLLGIIEHESCAAMRSRQTSRSSAEAAMGHAIGTLPRRVDRSGLLEAVPELPDHRQSWKHEENGEEKNVTNSGLTRDETMNNQRLNSSCRSLASPRILRSSDDPTNTGQTSLKRLSMELPRDADATKCWENRGRAASPGDPTSVLSSPYLRRYPNDRTTTSLERPTPVIIGKDESTSRNRENTFTRHSPSPNKFLPIDALPNARTTRQTCVDLTGTARSSTISPSSRSNLESTSTYCETDITKCAQAQQQPDCLGRLSPRTKNERQSPLTMSSSIPDVIEAHGSRSQNREAAQSPEKCTRAEAEGCEQRGKLNDEDENGTANDENRITFKGTKKMLHNDNIQTLRVIILSEQL